MFFTWPPSYHTHLGILLLNKCFLCYFSCTLRHFFNFKKKKWIWCLNKRGVHFSFLPLTVGCPMYDLVSLNCFSHIYKLGQPEQSCRIVEIKMCKCSLWTVKGHSNAKTAGNWQLIKQNHYSESSNQEVFVFRGFMTLSLLVPWLCASWLSLTQTQSFQVGCWVHWSALSAACTGVHWAPRAPESTERRVRWSALNYLSPFPFLMESQSLTLSMSLYI